MRKGKFIINVDESWMNEYDYTRRMWVQGDAPATVPEKPVGTRLALIAALATDGSVFFSLTHANTDSSVMLLFLSHLCRKLDSERPGFREDSVVLLDGARYHTSSKTRLVLKKLGLTVIFSGPYSYSSAPVELLFAGLKTGNLNPEGLKMSKK